jgi:L-alanine-DL-glutamate epimerase-like enolase superfamily enzyme
MALIEHVEIMMVDLVPKVRRTDAIQSFDSQETPIMRITDSEGAVGVGYTYTIGQGGAAIMSLLRETLVPQLIGREAEQIEAVWRDLLFSTHATSVGAITSLALAAIDGEGCSRSAGAWFCRVKDQDWQAAPVTGPAASGCGSRCSGTGL